MRTLLALPLCLAAFTAHADAPEVTAAEARASGSTWTFSVTLAHLDTGWDHYADGWRVETPDGTVLGTRELLHPHVNEQPFTRSLSGVAVPSGLTELRIRAHCNIDGWAEATYKLTLPGS